MTTELHQQLNRLLSNAGVSKIVYSLVTPETERVIDRVLDGAGVTVRNGRESFHAMFREAWTQKQDSVHEGFFDTWLKWSAPIVTFAADEFPFRYPTSGASEALREAIYAYGISSRQHQFTPRIHVFDGEYEGFAAYANAAGIELHSHQRSHWSEMIGKLAPTDQIYLSQPSAIDGMIWHDYDDFMQQLLKHSPKTTLMLDLTYVGCVSCPFTLKADYPNISALFFSLSKPAGVYYHRIGGMLARQEYPGLFGNKWFKNLTSLSIGAEFMRQHAVHELPTKYRQLQETAICAVNQQLGLSLQPADVFILGVGQPAASGSELENFLLRGSVGQQCVRVCLTARMAHAIDPTLSPHVSARHYEQLAE